MALRMVVLVYKSRWKHNRHAPANAVAIRERGLTLVGEVVGDAVGACSVAFKRAHHVSSLSL